MRIVEFCIYNDWKKLRERAFNYCLQVANMWPTKMGHKNVTSQSVMVVKQNASITTLYCLSEFKDLF